MSSLHKPWFLYLMLTAMMCKLHCSMTGVHCHSLAPQLKVGMFDNCVVLVLKKQLVYSLEVLQGSPLIVCQHSSYATMLC